MIELRWKKLDPGDRKYYHGMPDNSVVLIGGNAVLQYREKGTYTTTTEEGITTGLTELVYEWQDVEIE